ncbi:hypothetical protein D3C76_1466460 [compost metagenome]
MLAAGILERRAERNALLLGVEQLELDSAAFLPLEPGQHRRATPWYHLLGGVLQVDAAAEVLRIQGDPVDPVRLGVGHHRIAVVAGPHAGVAADADARNVRHFHQRESFAHGLAQVDAAGVGDHRA